MPRPPNLRRLGRRLRGRSGAVLSALTLAVAFAAALAAGQFARPAQAQIAVQNQGYVPFSDAPIHYRTRPLTDPVALPQKDLDAGKARLTHEPGHGYLKSVLKLLDIPVESQTLVFSKTSFQYAKISPEHPRALYYNDDVYVGSVHQGNSIEIISFDPMQGAIFYLLEEKQADEPVFQRAELDCTQCHIAASTRGVPGVMLRSVFPTKVGNVAPRTSSFITDQTSALKDRWGGWYVTGALAGASMSNAVVNTIPPRRENPSARTAPEMGAVEQPYDKSAYLAPGSDQVALLVLAHQTQMHNLITLTNYQTRLALHALEKAGDPAAAATTFDALPEGARRQIERPAEQLLRYLLFSNEATPGVADAKRAITKSAFARDFAARGLRDSKRRSLRDFDLQDRMFRYPCSYLIYSSAFDALPEPAKGYVYRRLLEVLSGKDQTPDFAGLSADDRQAILSILLETKPGLPAEWRQYARDRRLAVAAQLPRAQRTPANSDRPNPGQPKGTWR